MVSVVRNVYGYVIVASGDGDIYYVDLVIVKDGRALTMHLSPADAEAVKAAIEKELDSLADRVEKELEKIANETILLDPYLDPQKNDEAALEVMEFSIKQLQSKYKGLIEVIEDPEELQEAAVAAAEDYEYMRDLGLIDEEDIEEW